MSKRGKRGVASCSKKLEAHELHIDFDENMQPTGKNSERFVSDLGLKLRSRFSYHIDTKQFDKQKWEEIWLIVKEYWNIQDDRPKKNVIKLAKRNCTNWRSFLVREYVKKDRHPFAEYDYLDSSKWDEFVAKKTSVASLEKSEKASINARKNKDFARTGRSGFRGLKFDELWPQLVQSYPRLANMQHRHSQILVASRAKKNKQTGLYELVDYDKKSNDLTNVEKETKKDGSYYKGCADPTTRTFGPEHWGQTRTVSSDIKGSTQVQGGLYKSSRVDEGVNVNRERQMVEPSPGFCGSSFASGGSYTDYPHIQNTSACDLLWPFDLTYNTTVAKGQAYLTFDRSIMHTTRMHEGCVKVQVDGIMSGYEKMPVPAETRTDEIMVMEDTVNNFIQWPRNAIKILNNEASSVSTKASRKASRKASSNSVSSQIQTSSQTRACDVYIPQFDKQPEVNQQIPYNLDCSLDDFVTSMITGPEFCQLLKSQPSMVVTPMRKTIKEHDQEKQARKINAALEVIETRPERIQALVATLKSVIGDDTKVDPIEWSTPLGMYPDIITESIEYEALLQLFANGWVDITIISWFEMFYYKSSGLKANLCAFFGVNSITAHMCQMEPDVVEDHILGVYGIHSDKSFFLAPHLSGGHWSLFIISPKRKEVFILDSLKGEKDKNSYFLSKIIEDAFWEIQFTWRMVECKQQNNGWVCGYMLLIYMFQFVYGIQQDFPNLIWNDTSFVTQKEIDDFLVHMMPMFFKKLFEDRMG